MASSDLWQRSHIEKHLTASFLNCLTPGEGKDSREIHPLPISDAGIDYQFQPWQGHTVPSSFLGNDCKESAQSWSPFLVNGSKENNGSAVCPTMINLSFESQQYPLAWMSQNEDDSTYSRYKDDLFRDLDKAYVHQVLSTAATSIGASGTTDLDLSLEASLFFTSSETSSHIDTGHHKQGVETAPRMIDNGLQLSDFSENFKIKRVTTASSANAKGRAGIKSEKAAPRSTWQYTPFKFLREKEDCKDHSRIRSSKRQLEKKASKYKANDAEEGNELGDEKLVKFRSRDSLRYRCPFAACAKEFSTSGHARRHSRVHTNQRPFVCPQARCGSTFTRRDNCIQHQRSNHGSTTAPLRCSHDPL